MRSNCNFQRESAQKQSRNKIRLTVKAKKPQDIKLESSLIFKYDYDTICTGATITVGGCFPSDEGTFSYPPERRVIQMSFQEVILLLSLLGGAIYGTIQVCYIVFRKNEKNNRRGYQLGRLFFNQL